MPLVERLMGLNANGSPVVEPGPDRPHIPVHDFFAACQEMIVGRLTVAQVKNALGMDASEATEFDAMVALAPTGNTTANLVNKSIFVDSMHSVFILAEGRYTGYATPANVRSKLGLPTP